jgi:DNA-binding NarL/FixJ family response regulator
MNKPLASAIHSDNPHLRVLLVDDTPEVLHDLHQLLEVFGEMEIVGEAANGKEAIRLATDLSPDVVVMDLEMPIMNGYEATRQIKSHLLAPRVVILSVHGGPEQQEKARATGADAFVVKGASFDVLEKAILGK